MKRSADSGILVEAEAFDDFGGWVLDSQFEMEMGSPYLLAHGNGKLVADATTSIFIENAGEYNVWVRAKDWVPGHHPGRFTVAVNGIALDVQFGANDQDWNWQFGGKVRLSTGKTRLLLHDLAGFCGRCDAIFFSRDDLPPPEAGNEARAWRRRFRGLPNEPVPAGTFDVVVVGGGVPGAAATLTAARLGQRVALIHNRPYLGGNASVEIGLSPRGVTGPLVDKLSNRTPDGDLLAKQLLDAEPNATVFLEHTVYNTTITDSAITSVDARHARSGREIRLSAPVFIDCSGKAILGMYSGAETLFGQESQAQFGESLAPQHRDDMHHGNTVFFRTRMADSPVTFPDVPWATEVAKDFSNLGGQLRKPGIENGPGPSVVPLGHSDDPAIPRRMKRPLTHFWEYGQWLDPYTHGEHIRDHLLRAIYGTFSNVKMAEPDTYANLELDWVAYVSAQGEFRRYKGDYILTETDIRTHKYFPDAVVQNGGAFCLHYPGNEKYDFRLKYWEWDERDGKPYDIPFRSLYSVNISNLMMAGKHISVTHVAGSNTKFMGNGAQHAIAIAAAASLCNKYHTTPRGVYENHLAELKTIAAAITEVNCDSSHTMSKL
ncbi:FAD dependent oxidoreductase-domain-containing protein [Xylogone sp. PMI_703]|nr:FAD dependent oxidoreductase-domain-containing protein [Xylogone sp. PMI_703]